MINKFKPKSEFAQNILTLMTGTTIAQAIPIAISPILTRIYSPQDFGVLALFVAISSIFGSIANGRYELAIMLPKKDEDAINIVALGFIINIFISLILLLLISIFHDNIVKLLNNQDISFWLYFTPLSIFFIGCYHLLNYFNNRKKYYKDLAKATVLKSIISAIAQLLIGFTKEGASGLISGQLLSFLVANSKLLKNMIEDKTLLSKISKLKIVAVARKYQDFPKFSMFAVLANTLSQHLTNILISSFYSVATLGYFSLVQKVLGIPASLIGGSISQVFYQMATEEKLKTGKAVNSFYSTLKRLLLIGIPSFGILFFIVEDLFIFVFGKNWAIAGVYAKILIPLFFIRFIVSPVSVMNQVNLKNRLGMNWQIGLLILYMAILYISKSLNIPFQKVLYVIVIAISSYYIYFLYLINKHVREGNK